MKHKLAIVLIGGSLIVPLAAVAQITISQAQIEAVLGSGNTVRYYSDTTSMTANVGGQGGGNVYDFTSLPFYYVGRETVFSASAIPELAPRYPVGTVSLKLPAEDPSGGSFFINFTFPAGQWYNEGEAILLPAFGYEQYIHYVPHELSANFPMTYGAMFTQSLTDVDSTYIGGVLFSASMSAFSESTVVDGYGTLMLPGLPPMNCLRVRTVEYNGGMNKNFSYYTQEGAAVILDSDNSQPDVGLVQVQGVLYILGGSLSSVRESGGTGVRPEKFSLWQNYPNPFNPSTTIRFALPKAGFVVLKVFDALGQQVATLVEGERSPGEYAVEWNPEGLPSGSYFYRLEVDGNVEANKLILLK